MAQRVGRCIALLFHDRGTRRVVSSTPRQHFTPRKDTVPILQEAGWAPGQVWRGGKSRPHRDSIPDRPARSKSLYRLSYPAHTVCTNSQQTKVGDQTSLKRTCFGFCNFSATKNSSHFIVLLFQCFSEQSTTRL